MTVEDTPPDKEGETLLIRRILAGERECFRELILSHQAKVYSLLLRQLGNEAIARELAQETFLKAFSQLGKFRGEARFRTWLMRIALNVANGYFTSRRYKEAKQSVPIESLQIAWKNPPPDEALEHRQLREHLRMYLGSLPEKYREALVLYYLQEMPYKEISDTLRVPIGTVCSRINMGVQILRKKFERL